MATVSKLKKLLHRKALESVCPLPLTATAGSFICSDKFDLINGARAFYVAGASGIYMYEGQEDGWMTLPNSGIAGTFASGACGEFRGLGAMGGVFTQTATAGTTTTITSNRTVVRSIANQRIRVVAGTGVGYEGTVQSNTLGANAVITVTPANGVAFDATTQYQVYSGSLWFFNAGTTAVGFSVYDLATNAWTAKSVTGLPTAWGIDGALISTLGSAASFATGTSTGTNTSTTLNNTGKAWSTDMWKNYQIRITGGTGKGQIRTISTNSATAITVSSAWTVTPDATSHYSIEGDDDSFYLLGNNAVTMYKYSVSGNSWATLSPVAARAGAAAGGVMADWIDGVTAWNGNESQINHYNNQIFKQNGRYIYSFRGGGVSTLDVYDVAGNTWISNVPYGGQMETFTGGSSAIDISGAIYINKEATGRLFRFDVNENRLLPLNTNTQQSTLGGAALTGNRLFVLPYNDGGTTLQFLYIVRHSSADTVRMLLI